MDQSNSSQFMPNPDKRKSFLDAEPNAPIVKKFIIYHLDLICDDESASLEERAEHILYYYCCSRRHTRDSHQQTNQETAANVEKCDQGGHENGYQSYQHGKTAPCYQHYSWTPSSLLPTVTKDDTSGVSHNGHVHSLEEPENALLAEQALRFSGFCQALSNFVTLFESRDNDHDDEQQEGLSSSVSEVHLTNSTLIYIPLEDDDDTGDNSLSADSKRTSIVAVVQILVLKENSNDINQNGSCLGSAVPDGSVHDINPKQRRLLNFGAKGKDKDATNHSSNDSSTMTNRSQPNGAIDSRSIRHHIRRSHRLFSLLHQGGIHRRLGILTMGKHSNKGTMNAINSNGSCPDGLEEDKSNHANGAREKNYNGHCHMNTLAFLRRKLRKMKATLDHSSLYVLEDNGCYNIDHSKDKRQEEGDLSTSIDSVQSEISKLLQILPISSLRTDLQCFYDDEMNDLSVILSSKEGGCHSIVECIPPPSRHWTSLTYSHFHRTIKPQLSFWHALSTKRLLLELMNAFQKQRIEGIDDFPASVVGISLFCRDVLIDSYFQHPWDIEELMSRDDMVTLYDYLTSKGEGYVSVSRAERGGHFDESGNFPCSDECSGEQDACSAFLSPPPSDMSSSQRLDVIRLDGFGSIWTPSLSKLSACAAKSVRVALFKVDTAWTSLLYLRDNGSAIKDAQGGGDSRSGERENGGAGNIGAYFEWISSTLRSVAFPPFLEPAFYAESRSTVAGRIEDDVNVIAIDNSSGRSVILFRGCRNMSYRDPYKSSAQVMSTMRTDERYEFAATLPLEVITAFDDIFSEIQVLSASKHRQGGNSTPAYGGICEVCSLLPCQNQWVCGRSFGDYELYVTLDSARYRTVRHVQLTLARVRTELLRIPFS